MMAEISEMTAVRSIFEAHSRARRLSAGDVLYVQGSRAETVYLVVGGELEMSRTSPSDEELKIGIKGPVSLLGEAAALTGTNRSITARAIGEAEVLELPSDAFVASVRADAAASFELAVSLAASLQSSTQ